MKKDRGRGLQVQRQSALKCINRTKAKVERLRGQLEVAENDLAMHLRDLAEIEEMISGWQDKLAREELAKHGLRLLFSDDVAICGAECRCGWTAAVPAKTPEGGRYHVLLEQWREHVSTMTRWA